MKITFTDKLSKVTTKIELTEGDRVQFIEKQGKHYTLRIGIGKKKDITKRKFILLARKIIQVAKQHKIKQIAIAFDNFDFPRLSRLDTAERASLLTQNFEMANFEFTSFRTKPKEGWPEVKEIVICGKVNAKVKEGFKKGQIIGNSVNECRELSNTPGGDMTPAILAKRAKNAARGPQIKVSILGEKELAKLKMGAILGVSKGSSEAPRLIVMEYWGAGKSVSGKSRPIVLVGKGVTFDSGGINLKPGDSALGMHLDMSGGAAVISSLVLAAKLKIKKNIIGIVPAVENMPGGSSYRPGDVLRSMSGKTIEIMNTDAEGRVILADAITYAKKYKPRLIVDVATLTGAAMVALGQRASAIMTKDRKLESLFIKLAEESGDYMWSLPLWEEYEEEVKGSRGDVTNTHNKSGRYGGAINGGIFLHEFARGLPWVHIDIAPRMESIPSDNLAPGAAGEPVRFLLKLIESY